MSLANIDSINRSNKIMKNLLIFIAIFFILIFIYLLYLFDIISGDYKIKKNAKCTVKNVSVKKNKNIL